MIKAVIFDFDGVLVESAGLKTESFARLFEAEGPDIVKKIVDYHRQNQGVSRFDKFRYIYDKILKRELSSPKFDNLCARFSQLVKDEVIAAPYVSGAKEFLQDYSSRYSCFISSATPEPEIVDIINSRKMECYFKGIYGAPKPKEDIVSEILHKYNLKGSEVVYIGDALSDYKAAIANNTNFIARINDNEKIFSTICCLKIKNLQDLNQTITNNFISKSGANRKIILVHASSSPRKLAKSFPNTRWIFFGQGYLKRLEWIEALGADLKINYKDLLTELSISLKDEFISWSVRLGRPHWDKWYWWISRLANRNNLNSKFYLYVCYIEVLKRILRQDEQPLIIISDNWELMKVIDRYTQRQEVVLRPYAFRSAIGKSYSYCREKIFFVLAWGYFFIKNIYELLACRLSRTKNHPKKDYIYNKAHVVIHTCVDDGCISDDGVFKDRYFPGLADYLTSKGKKVSTLIWLYNVKNKNLFNVFRWFRSNNESFLIPQDYYNILDCLYAFFITVKSAMFKFSKKDAYFKSVDISPLIRLEQALQARDIGAAGFITRIKLFRKWKSLGYSLKTYIDLWELKNCEVEAIIEIRNHYPDSKTIGFQHNALVSGLLFGNYITTPDEFEASPHPDFGVVNSVKVKEFLIDEGFPESFLRLGPALRYSWIKKALVPQGDLVKKESILICLSLSLDISVEIMEMAFRALGNNPDYKIWVKLHPMMPKKKLMQKLSFNWPANFSLAQGTIGTWVKRAKLVITGQSSAMVDAISMGTMTVVIGRETDIDIIPLYMSENTAMWKIAYNPKQLADAVDEFYVLQDKEINSATKDFFEFRMELLNEII